MLEGLIPARGTRMRLCMGRLPCSGVPGSRGGAALQLYGCTWHRPRSLAAARAACGAAGSSSTAHSVQAGLQRLVLLGGLRWRGLRGALLGRRRARQVRHRRARHVQQHLHAGAGRSLVMDTRC